MQNATRSVPYITQDHIQERNVCSVHSYQCNIDRRHPEQIRNRRVSDDAGGVPPLGSSIESGEGHTAHPLAPATGRNVIDTITMLTQYVATMFVASLIGLAMTVPSDSTQALSGAAVVSGALGMLSAVAALALGYAKAVHVANHDG